MTKIKTLKDSEGNSFYPQTHTKSIVDDNGNNLEAIFSEQEKQLDNKIAEHSTVRFDRIEENEATINAGEVDVLKEVIYYKPANKFVAADSAGNYWDTWDGMDAYMNGGTIRKEKIYLCKDKAYISSDNSIIEVSPDLDKRIIGLVGIFATSTFYAPNWEIGDIMFNSTTNKLRKCREVDEYGDVKLFEDVELSKNAIYSLNGNTFFYDGVGLSPNSGIIKLSSISNTSPLTEIGQYYYSETNKKIGILTSSPSVAASYLFSDSSRVLLEWNNGLYRLVDGEMIKIPFERDLDIRLNSVKELVALTYLGSSGNNYTSWQVGDIMYNTTLNKLRKCISTDGNGNATLFEDYHVSDLAMLFYKGNTFTPYENGLKLSSDVVRLFSITNSEPLTETGILYYSNTNKDIRLLVSDSDAVKISVENPLLIYEYQCYVLDSNNNLVPVGIKGERGEKGDKGEQGNSGYSGAVGELEVVNNLTQGGATAALSAQQGVVLNRWRNYNSSSLTIRAQNKASLLQIPTSAWYSADSLGRVAETDKDIYDDIDKKYVESKDCISLNSGSLMDGARFVAKLDTPIDMTYNVLRGAVYQDMKFPVTNLGGISLSLYSDNLIDASHRAHTILNYGYNGTDESYVRSGWHHFCLNIPLMGTVGASFNISNVTHVSFNVNHAAGSEFVSSVCKWDILPPIVKPGIVTIVDNFNPNVPAMADYAASKGVKLNLSIVPNWVGDDSRHGTLQQIYNAAHQGHFIFNHTWNHQIYGGQTDIEIFEQIQKADRWMVQHGFIRGAKILSVPSAAFDNQKYKAFFGSEAAMIYHHWTPLERTPYRDAAGTPRCTLYYPYKGMERLLNISALDSYFTNNISQIVEAAEIGIEAAKIYGGILIFGFHGYGKQHGGYMPDESTWKEYIDTISQLDIYHYTIDELAEGCVW